LSLRRAIGDKSGEATTLNNIGFVYHSLGVTNKALQFYNQALLLRKTVGDRRSEAQALNNIGGIYNDLGKKKKALRFFKRALSLSRAAGEKRGEAYTLNNIGGVHHSFGDKQKALQFYNQALSLSRAIRDKSGEALALNNLGGVFIDLGEKQKGLRYFHRALPPSSAVGDKIGEAYTLRNVMYAWESLQKPAVAVFYGKQSVNKYQELRQAIQGLDKDIQKTYLEKVKPTYRRLADLMIELGRFAQAERVLAMLKEEEYFEFVRRDSNEIKNLNERVPLNEKEKALIMRYSLLAGKITKIGGEFIKLDDKKRRLSRNDLKLSADEQKRYDTLEKTTRHRQRRFSVVLE